MNPPDLEEFCKEFGGLGAMTAERWKEWEALHERYRQFLDAQQKERMRQHAEAVKAAAAEEKANELQALREGAGGDAERVSPPEL
jgi:predicted alpha/beta hydrolase